MNRPSTRPRLEPATLPKPAPVPRGPNIGEEPCPRFVVACGYDPVTWAVEIVDPYRGGVRIPASGDTVTYERSRGAVLPGVPIHDADFVVVRPSAPHRER